MKQIHFVAKMQNFGLIENYFCGDHDYCDLVSATKPFVWFS
jgi:hypothetical protein